MRAIASQIAALFTLVAFMVTTSGWVLHHHYCPVSDQLIVSLVDEAVCAVPEVQMPGSCCEMPAELDLPVCGKDQGCCEDQVILLELPSPYTLPAYENGDWLHLSGLQAPVRTEVALWVSLPGAELPTHPLPPPPLRSLDRLNELQVYRT